MIPPIPMGWLWGLLPGPREWALVALVAFALYGRSETARRGFARAFRPWTTRPASTGADGRSAPAWLGDRWFLVVAASAAAAVAAWVVTWMTIVHRPGP